VVKLTKDNKFVETKNGDRVSCIVINPNRKEAYEVFKVSDSNPIRFTSDDNITVYAVRFSISSDLEDVDSKVIFPNSRLVKNEYLDL
jgi:hypothetical protein